MKLTISEGFTITPEIREKLNFLRDKGPIFALRRNTLAHPGWKVVVTEVKVTSAREVRMYGFEYNLTSGRGWYDLAGTNAFSYILEEATL